jgi:poly[ADP-ribose] polymerase 16
LFCNFQFEDIRKLAKDTSDTPSPSYIFELDWNEAENAAWNAKKGSKESFFAYHGSRLENFHSILRLGLHQHMNQVGHFYSSSFYSI